MVVVDTPAGRLGLTTCYDLRFPEMYAKLTWEMGAQVRRGGVTAKHRCAGVGKSCLQKVAHGIISSVCGLVRRDARRQQEGAGLRPEGERQHELAASIQHAVLNAGAKPLNVVVTASCG